MRPVRKCGSLRASTENGRIVASDVAGALDLATRNGAIELDVARVERRPGDRISATTENGAIDLVLPGDFPADLDLSTANGSVDLAPASFGAGEAEASGSAFLKRFSGTVGEAVNSNASGGISPKLVATLLESVSRSGTASIMRVLVQLKK